MLGVSMFFDTLYLIESVLKLRGSLSSASFSASFSASLKKKKFRREATSIHADYFVRPSVHMCHCLRTLSSLNLSLMEVHFRHYSHRRHFITSYLKLSFGCHICRIVRSFGEFIFSFSYFNMFLEMLLFVHL